MKSAEWKWWHEVQSCRGWGPKIQRKKKKPESTFYTSQTTIHIHSEKMQSEQIAYGKTEAESGNMTVVASQWQSREEIPDFLSPSFIMYPLGSTELLLHQRSLQIIKTGLWWFMPPLHRQTKDAEKLHCGKVNLWGDLEQIKDFVSQFSILSVENAAGSQLLVEGSSSIVFWISFKKKKKICTCSMSSLYLSSKDSESL